MTKKKQTTLPSLRNQDWKKSTKKIRKDAQIINRYPNSITELNKLIYAGTKKVCDKIGVPLTNLKSKWGWEFRIKGLVKKLKQQAKMLRKENNKGIFWDEEARTKHQTNIKMQLKEIIQNTFVKEGRLKRYLERVKHCNQNRKFLNYFRWRP